MIDNSTIHIRGDLMQIRAIAALIINILIVLFTLNAHNLFQRNIEKIHPGKSKFHFYIYFTSDSNLYNALCSLIMIPYLIMVITGRAEVVPSCIFALHFTGTCAVLVTFMTVMLFLGPIAGYSKMFKGSDLYLHMVCPLMSAISCAIFVPAEEAPFYLTFLGIIPTVVYGLVYIYMVLIKGPANGGWEDFYTFNRGGKWYVSLLLMFTGSYLIALGLMYLCRLFI